MDFIRGIAVLGILAANIHAFGQPMIAYFWPEGALVEPSEETPWMWLAQFVLIDGKMRGMFSILFGAGMMLFMERAWAAGHSRGLQMRRLVWLLVFGLIHYFFLWRGDILTLYAMCGMIGLLALRWQARTQMITGMALYLLGAAYNTALFGFLYLVTETPLGLREDMSGAREEVIAWSDKEMRDGQNEAILISQGDYGGWVAHNFSAHGWDWLGAITQSGLETIPLMLIGMALYRFGLFSGQMDHARQALWGWVALLCGACATLLIGLWSLQQGLTFPVAMFAFLGPSTFTRLPMIMGLMALLALYAPRATGWLGIRLRAAGQVAFTNYIGTSALMLLVFHGWALGQYGEFGRAQLYLVVMAGWIIMLAWPKPWLKHFRYGPLEWLWRCLTYGKIFSIRRVDNISANYSQ